MRGWRGMSGRASNFKSEDLRFDLSIYLSVCLSVCLPVCLHVCVPVCLPACLPACPSVCLLIHPLPHGLWPLLPHTRHNAQGADCQGRGRDDGALTLPLPVHLSDVQSNRPGLPNPLTDRDMCLPVYLCMYNNNNNNNNNEL